MLEGGEAKLFLYFLLCHCGASLVLLDFLSLGFILVCSIHPVPLDPSQEDQPSRLYAEPWVVTWVLPLVGITPSALAQAAYIPLSICIRQSLSPHRKYFGIPVWKDWIYFLKTQEDIAEGCFVATAGAWGRRDSCKYRPHHKVFLKQFWKAAPEPALFLLFLQKEF